MNAYEYLYLLGRLRGIADTDLCTLVDNLITLTDLKEYAHRECGGYRCALPNFKQRAVNELCSSAQSLCLLLAVSAVHLNKAEHVCKRQIVDTPEV
ncbi:hypothetical protein HPB48_014041 [Haemaphysalis longicornis]|uniref:Uncharacterized protein n=1 Tax=Haemaphysalis longicornis TaxID=44386 RepID=A0A9J6GUT3_HAELO|nr:hypothetical protein HPB48_014041 [Haemaphysalis longicornis]